MATRTKRATAKRGSQPLQGDQILAMYRTMVAARRTDDQEILLKRQNKIFFQISGAGHEAVQVAIAAHCRPGSDWFYFYYRDRALSLALGMTPYEHLLQAVGAATDPSSGGRQMPSHWGHRPLHIVSTSSPTGTQYLQAVGCAEAGMRAGRDDAMRAAIDEFASDEIVICTTGEGQTSQGEFWEALNSAANLKLPVIFLVEDNGYAISVPVEVNTAGGSISRLVSGFPDLHIEEFDGTNIIESHEACGRAVEYARKRNGPALLHAHVVRPYSHSMSDDERAYRTEVERQDDAARDPLIVTRRYLIDNDIASADELDALEEDVEQVV
jgi:2-oxoisovalerate dehydrogenase E1 component